MIHRNDSDEVTSYKRAATFFKRLGHHDNGHASPSSSPIPRASIERFGDKTHHPDLDRKLHQNPRRVGFGGSSLYDLDDSTQHATPASDSSRLSFNLDPTTATLQLQDSTHSPCLQSLPLWSIISERSVAAVDTHADKDYKSKNVIVPGNKTHVSPIQVSTSQSGVGACVTSLQLPQSDAPTLHSFIKKYTGPSFNESQSSIGSTKGIDTPSPTTFHGSESSYCEEKISSHAYIAVLCNSIRAMSDEWIPRLALSAKTPQLDSQYYARTLFTWGIAALSNNFRGAGPSSFRDVLAMTHVVITSSSIVREDYDERSWKLILEATFQWKDLISDTIEREIFVRIMRRQCHPSQFTDLSAIHNCTMEDGFLPAEETTIASLIRNLSSTQGDSRIHEEVGNNCQNPKIDERQTNQPRIPQGNVAMEAFTDFLDGNYKCLCGTEINESDAGDRFCTRCHCRRPC